MPKKGETQKKMKKKEEEDILETLVFSSENVNKSFVNSPLFDSYYSVCTHI